MWPAWTPELPWTKSIGTGRDLLLIHLVVNRLSGQHPLATSRISPAARRPERMAPSTCMRPVPAMSELAKCSGPIARLMSGPNRTSPPGPNVGE